MADLAPLRDAGYRERVFAKALLVSNGQADAWPDALDQWRYDARRDEVVDLDGDRTKVRWEPSRSREVLAEHGFDDADCHGPTVGDLTALRERVTSELREQLRPFSEQANDADARARAREVVRAYLQRLVEEEPLLHREVPAIEEDPDQPGVFAFTLPRYDVPLEVEIPPTQEELDYLDDVAAAYLAAPEHSEEEELLEKVHALACERIRVDAQRHMEEATALGKVQVSPETPFAARLVGSLAAALEGRHAEWLGEEPWREWGGEEAAPTWFAEMAVRGVALALDGYVFAERPDVKEPEASHDVDVLQRGVIAAVVLQGVEVGSMNMPVLALRCRLALDVARGG